MKRLMIGLAVAFSLLAQTALAGEYTVKSGDCLSKIGKQSEVAWRQIAKANSIKTPYVIYPGQKLQIPGVGGAEPMAKFPAAEKDSPYLTTIQELKVKIAELEKRLAADTAAVGEKLEEKKIVAAAPAKIEEDNGQVKKVMAEKVMPVADLSNQADKIVSKSRAAGDEFDAFMSVGGWTSTGNKDSANGAYGQAKVRYRPFTFNAFGHEVGVGGFILGETGSGSTGKWNFSWNKLGVGPSAKIYGNNWDASTDLGFLREWSFGSSDKQITDYAYFLQYLNLEQRRAAQKKWFPQTEFVFSASAPFSAAKESTKGKTAGKEMTADNKATFGLDLKQSIYDFQVSDHFQLTPGVILGGGYEATNAYGKIGPFLKLRSYGQDILTAEMTIRDKSNMDGVRWYTALMFHVGGTIKAIKAAGISEAKAEDLVASKK